MLLRLFFILFCCYFAASSALADDAASSWRGLFESGRAHMEAGRYQEAIDDLIGSLSFEPQNTRSLSLLGTIFYRLGKIKPARFYWEKVLLAKPDDPIILSLLAKVYPIPLPEKTEVVAWHKAHMKGEKLFSENKNEESLKEFNEALKHFPDNKFSLFSRGNLFYKMGEKEKAKADWLAIQKYEPDNSMVRDLLRYFERGGMLIDTLEGLAKNPDDFDLHFRAGESFLKKGELEKALYHFKRVLELNKEYPGAVQGIAAVAFVSGNYDESVKLLAEISDKYPDMPVFKAQLDVISKYAEVMRNVKFTADMLDDMVLIPAGEFTMGEYDPETNIDERPIRKVTLPAFYIDKYEVTNKEYAKFVSSTNISPPGGWDFGKYKEGTDYFPVVNVNWYEADAYCRWESKRLPSEEEWEKAARGIEAFRFPWGDAFKQEFANTRASGFQRAAHVAAYDKGSSSYGVFNMAGNVWEWTADWYDAYPGNNLQRKEFGKLYKVQRGGSFLTNPIMHSRTSSRDAQLPAYTHRTTGFRCAKD